MFHLRFSICTVGLKIQYVRGGFNNNKTIQYGMARAVWGSKEGEVNEGRRRWGEDAGGSRDLGAHACLAVARFTDALADGEPRITLTGVRMRFAREVVVGG